MPLYVNLFGAPGAGKSTTRAGVFRRLKLARLNVEEVPEVAKDLTWEKRHVTLKSQIYIFGKQLRNMERLMDQVDIIVTDSPVLLSAFYAKTKITYPPSFYQLVRDIYGNMQPSLDFLIKRVKPYNPAGRNQDEAGSDEIANALPAFLDAYGAKYMTVDGDELADMKIANAVFNHYFKVPVPE